MESSPLLSSAAVLADDSRTDDALHRGDDESKRNDVYYSLEGEDVSKRRVGYLYEHDPSKYSDILESKTAQVLEKFQPYLQDLDHPLQTFHSPSSHYRLRAKFGVAKDPSVNNHLTYIMWDETMQPVPLQYPSFPMASERINEMMPKVLVQVQSSSKLCIGLRSIGFLDTLAKKDLLLVSFTYDVPIDEAWAEEARSHLKDILGVKVVGRSRGVCFALDDRHVLEELQLKDGRVVTYQQIEGSFSNPNGHMAIHTLSWLCERANDIVKRHQEKEAEPTSGVDLLELFCGAGTHTIALASKFRNVVGVEFNRGLVKAGQESLALNNIANAYIIALPSEKFRPSSLLANKLLPQEIKFDFKCVLVDPPKAGLDVHTRNLVVSYEDILYISCQPMSLLRDIEEKLGQTHFIAAMVIFDHFPYTKHIEVGVHLKKRKERSRRSFEKEEGKNLKKI